MIYMPAICCISLKSGRDTIYMPAMHDKNVLLEAESLIAVCHSSGSIEHKQHANACRHFGSSLAQVLPFRDA